MNRRNIFKLAMVLSVFTLILFPSCENNIPEEIQIEVVDINDSWDQIHTLEDVLDQMDYFYMTLYKVVGKKDTDSERWNDSSPDKDILIFENQRLDKNQMLLLEDLEPGIYYLKVIAMAENYSEQMQETYVYEISQITVTVTSDNAVTVYDRGNYSYECIAIEQHVPTFIKLLIEYYRGV